MDDYNRSDGDNFSLGEFPYWRSTLSISLVTSTLMSSWIVAVHVLLMVVLLKKGKEHFKPFNLVHVSLLVSNILEEVIRCILDFIYLPSIQRHCICSVLVGTIYALELTFFSVYRPYMFAGLGVLQFLLIVGKKKFVNTKTAIGATALCIGISLIFISLTARVFYETNERLFCYDNHCPSTDSESQSGPLGDNLSVFIAIILCSFLPSLVMHPVHHVHLVLCRLQALLHRRGRSAKS